MKKALIITLTIVLLVGSFFVAKPSTAQAFYDPTSSVAEGNWNTGTAAWMDLSGTTYPDWLMPLTPVVSVEGAGQICHPFRGGLFGWTGEIMQLVGTNWVKLNTTVGWIPNEEGAYTACAMAPAAGKYALFGYYDPAKVPVKTAAYCNSGKWWGNYYKDYPEDSEYYLSIQLPADFPEDVEFSFEVTAVSGGVEGISVGDTASEYTYMWDDGFVYVDYPYSFTITPNDPGEEGTVWSITFNTNIKGCAETVTITNADYWGVTNPD